MPNRVRPTFAPLTTSLLPVADSNGILRPRHGADIEVTAPNVATEDVIFSASRIEEMEAVCGTQKASGSAKRPARFLIVCFAAAGLLGCSLHARCLRAGAN